MLPPAMTSEEPDPFTPGYGEFQGIPQRTLPDDCMAYTLFVISDSLTTPVAIRTRLEEVKSSAEKLVAEWSAGYIWQREGFNLELKEVEKRWCLQGRTEYGDAVDDEWFIVWMLRELSRKFKDLWVRIYDTDGEFLLIEAANVLPRWLNPEIADNRVWLNAGKLLIIPLSSAAAVTPQNAKTKPISRPLSIAEALATITACRPESLQRIRLVEEEAFYRTTHYPDAAASHLHHALIRVPRSVAMVLHQNPRTIAAAVEAFYLRDPISAQAIKTMKRFPPNDCVTISAKFTKVLYAQLKGQQWEPPASSGFKIPDPKAKNFNEVDIGAKVACGFEMLLAKESLITSESRRKAAGEVNDILKDGKLPSDEEIKTWEKKVDSEDWLDIDYEEFERDLSGKGGPPSTGYGDKATEEKLKKMVERFEEFLNDDEAGAEGAEFEDDMDVDDDDEDEESTDDDEDKEVSFDENEFARMMREMMGMPVDKNGIEKDAEDEEEEIRKVQDQIEEELREAGAIEREKPRITELRDDTDGAGDGAVNIDYTLAKNILESFKGQGGLAGPGGNLLSRMGIALPKDEPDEEERQPKDTKGKAPEI